MIYVIAHKNFNDSILDSQHYAVLRVGPYAKEESNYLSDAVGNNISEKNPNYSELTGLYWIWKNVPSDPETIVGMVHYRRYFTTKRRRFLYDYFGKQPLILEYEKIRRSLENYDMIVPSKLRMLKETVKSSYGKKHFSQDLEAVHEVIADLFPKYLDAYNRVMKRHAFYYANVMICRKCILDEYAKWLFQILFSAENKIDLSKYADPYQARVFGFLSERLFNVWIEYNKLSVKEFPLFNMEKRERTIWKKSKDRCHELMKIISGKKFCKLR